MNSNQIQRGFKVLIACEDFSSETAIGRSVTALVNELRRHSILVNQTILAADANTVVAADPSIECVILDWNLQDNNVRAVDILKTIRRHNTELPVFLLSDRGSVQDIPLEIIENVDDFIWILEDTPDFIVGRIIARIKHYRESILPPMFSALMKFARVHEYSWHTPGHEGGVAFLKSPIGRAFFYYFGENLFRSDLSISVGELGSLLDHSGPIGMGEAYAAKVFGADHTYYVTNGSSTSNRVIMMASVTHDQIALCDRNCHKSIEHAITMSGAIPTYMMPSRNAYGIIGPIYPEHLTAQAIKESIQKNALVTESIDPKPVHAVITNSTYDGLCYNVKRINELLGGSVDRLHFDEAWYGYARFNPIYANRYAMYNSKDARKREGPTIFSTQSTHKLLAALSQASMIHVQDGRSPISHERFNESFMMHASTSPQYAIIASNDVSAAMMNGQGGFSLTTESIQEAVAFRQLMAKTQATFQKKKDWFFKCWQPEEVRYQNINVPFYQVPANHLIENAAPWVLHPNQAWHGFKDLEDEYCMLDPIKVSIVTPGIGGNGKFEESGIPATIVTSYLAQRGTIVEKTTDFTILVLFSLGTTKGKWGALLNELLSFKRDYDVNKPLSEVLPTLTEKAPEIYMRMGLKDLCEKMYGAMKKLQITEKMAAAFSVLPEPKITPAKAYECLVKNQVIQVDLDGLANTTLATGIVPYPPGIPLLMPGENSGSQSGAPIMYLKALEDFDAMFPEFSHDIHGVEQINGKYHFLCVR